MRDEGYNGWANYPTWAVNLWLSNDESLYHWTLEKVAGVLMEEHPVTDVWTVEQSRRFRTADVLKEWVTDEVSPDLGASFAADLLGWALGSVDWDEIADAWIEQVQEQVEV